MPSIVFPSGAGRPALKAISPRVLIAAHPKLKGSKPSSTLLATSVKVYCGAVCARASASTAPITRHSAVERAKDSANRRSSADGRLWVSILPPSVDRNNTRSLCRRSLSLLCHGMAPKAARLYAADAPNGWTRPFLEKDEPFRERAVGLQQELGLKAES